MEPLNFWFSPLDYNYYLNNVPITKEIMNLQMEDRLKFLNERVIKLENEMEIAEFQNMIEQQRYAMEHNCSNNSLKTRNIAYDKPKKVEPFIVVFKSKPIQGIVLELWGKNPEYNWEIETEITSNMK